MNDSGYIPVSCAMHSEFELAIMQRRILQLVYHVQGNKISETVMPVDILTREGAEYLLVNTEHGQQKQIRLDDIVEANPVD